MRWYHILTNAAAAIAVICTPAPTGGTVDSLGVSTKVAAKRLALFYNHFQFKIKLQEELVRCFAYSPADDVTAAEI